MRKIHTKIRIDINTGDVLEDAFYLYDGPVVMCGEDPGDASGYGGAFESGAFQNAAWEAEFGQGARSAAGDKISGLLGSFTDPLTGDLFSQPEAWGSFVDPTTGTAIDPTANYAGRALGAFENPSWGEINTDFNSAVKPSANWGWTAKGLSLGLILAGIPGALVGTVLGLMGGYANSMGPRDALNNALAGVGIYGQTDKVMSNISKNPSGNVDLGGGDTGVLGGTLPDQIDAGGTNQTTGGGGVNVSGGNYQDVLAQIAMDMYNKTDPARQNILDRGQNFLEGGLDVTQSPMWGSGKNAAETQYRLARDATMANLPGGGALQSSLARGETDKARTLTDLASQIGMDEYNKIYGLASGAPQQSMAGLGTAAGANASFRQTAAYTAAQQAAINQRQDESKNQLYSDMGSEIGEGFGDKG